MRSQGVAISTFIPFPAWVVYLGLSIVAAFVFGWILPGKIDRAADLDIQVSIPSQSDWSDYGTIFEQGDVGDWDYQLWGGFAGTAVKRNGTYYLYYQGASGYRLLPDETVTWRAIGVATSPDGVNFTKHSNNPILT